jgi:hypothetical protein
MNGIHIRNTSAETRMLYTDDFGSKSRQTKGSIRFLSSVNFATLQKQIWQQKLH